MVTNAINIISWTLSLEHAPQTVIDGQNTLRIFNLGTNDVELIGLSIVNGGTGSDGGGMYQGTATHCTITQNKANTGGGIYSGRANNSILWNNTADDEYTNTRTTLRNCTVVENWAFDTGGAYSTYIYNSIIWDNFALTNAANVTAGISPRNSCYPEANPAGSY